MELSDRWCKLRKQKHPHTGSFFPSYKVVLYAQSNPQIPTLLLCTQMPTRVCWMPAVLAAILSSELVTMTIAQTDVAKLRLLGVHLYHAFVCAFHSRNTHDAQQTRGRATIRTTSPSWAYTTPQSSLSPFTVNWLIFPLRMRMDGSQFVTQQKRVCK